MADLARLGGGRFLVIGRAGMDLYADPPGAQVEHAIGFTTALGGSSANIAAAIMRGGGQAALLTCVSDDAIGRFCLNQLDAFGIDRTHVRVVGGEARNSLALVETRTENTQSVIYRNGAADFALTPADAEAVDMEDFSAVIATGTTLAAEPSRSAVMHVFSIARMAGVPLIFDIDHRPYSWTSAKEASAVLAEAAALCDLVVGNDVEFGFLSGDKADGLGAARALVEAGAAAAIYKMGEKGAITVARAGETRTGIYRTAALKPTGAGDAFLGNLVIALASGHPLDKAVLRGSAAAAMVVARVGCAPAMPTTDELDAFMAQNRPTHFEEG
jgi:5-dehydro-2-deoxygluconokinase